MSLFEEIFNSFGIKERQSIHSISSDSEPVFFDRYNGDNNIIDGVILEASTNTGIVSASSEVNFSFNNLPVEIFKDKGTEVFDIDSALEEPGSLKICQHAAFEEPMDGPMRTTFTNTSDITITLVNKLKEDINKLQRDLSLTNIKLTKSRRDYNKYIRDMQKELDAGSQRDAEAEAKNMALHLENEKLKTALITKTQVIQRYQRELGNLKNVVKLVITGSISPMQLAKNFDFNFDEGGEMDNKFKKDLRVQFAPMPHEMSVPLKSDISDM